MIPLLRDFVRDVADAIELPDPIVEFGALQVEVDQEIDLRPLFGDREYLGTDFREGPGVDRVEDLRSLTFGDDSIGTAICLETLEHVEDPIAAGRELARVVAPGGVAIVSTPLLLGIHGYPNDYFRYTPEGLAAVLAGFDEVLTLGLGDPSMPQHVVALGANGRQLAAELRRAFAPSRAPGSGRELALLPALAAAQQRYDRAPGVVRVGPLRVPPRELARTLAAEAWRLVRRRDGDSS